MFNKILIANRGEIAVRIIRAAREMGIETVAVYSEGDKESLHRYLADEAICIGPAPAKDSYLKMENILSAAILSGADAIHPGYGFLSENQKFTSMCRDCGIKFVGPHETTMKLMGNKSKAKKIAKQLGIPVVPGSDEVVTDLNAALKIAESIGYPIMLKAANGGGGRGIRAIKNQGEMIKIFNVAKAEATAAFGNGSMYIEKFIQNPKHIEVQVLCDSYKNVIYFPERDCSIQRKHQKIIEETPSAIVDTNLRKNIGEAAVRLAKEINYEGAGTVEFLLDDEGNFYFMEMNTRIQVEHGITELVTGIDLVKEQLKIASGEPLKRNQKDIKILGHAIECRINAENPFNNFIPSAGKIRNVIFPGGLGIRVDTAIYGGYIVPPYYDSMIAKLMSFGENRLEAISRIRRALEEFIIDGIDTNIEYNLSIVSNKDFLVGNVNTAFIDKHEFYLKRVV